MSLIRRLGTDNGHPSRCSSCAARPCRSRSAESRTNTYPKKSGHHDLFVPAGTRGAAVNSNQAGGGRAPGDPQPAEAHPICPSPFPVPSLWKRTASSTARRLESALSTGDTSRSGPPGHLGSSGTERSQYAAKKRRSPHPFAVARRDHHDSRINLFLKSFVSENGRLGRSPAVRV